MGEATYYMKVTFETEGQAEEALPKITELFREGHKAYEWWQNHRRMKPEDFWPKFAEQFPQVSEYLKTVTVKYSHMDEYEGKPAFGGDCNNNLAGTLDFCGEEEDADEWCRNTGTSVLTYSAEVWHFADWGPLAAYIQAIFKPLKVSWISDEDVSPFELLD